MAEQLQDQLDDLQDRFEVEIGQSSVEKLLSFAEYLGMEASEQRRAKLLRNIRARVEASLGTDLAQNIEYMTGILAYDWGISQPSAQVEDAEARLQREEDDRRQRDLAAEVMEMVTQQRQLEQNQREDFARNSALNGAYPMNMPQEPRNTQPYASRSQQQTTGKTGDETEKMMSLMKALADANIAARRQLKIVGVIGDMKSDKNITYVNLLSQVSDAKSQKYTEDEIVRAIRKAVAVTSDLRTYFDGSVNMSLEKMLEVLRNYYQERSAAELFGELGQLVQGPQEKSTDFLLRAMQLPQRIQTASEAEGSAYGSKLVSGTFVRAVETGLREESVSSHLAKYLTVEESDDSVLLREANSAELKLEEKQKKQKQVRQVKIAQAQVAESQDNSLKTMLEGIQRRLDGIESLHSTRSRDNRSLEEQPRGNRLHGDRLHDDRSYGDRSRGKMEQRRDGSQPREVSAWPRDNGDRNSRAQAWQNSGDARQSNEGASAWPRDARWQQAAPSGTSGMGANRRQRSSRCDKCRRDDVYCRHCFRCAGEGHMAKDCPKSGN